MAAGEGTARKSPTKRRKPENPEFKAKDRTLRQDVLHLRKMKRLAGEAAATAADKKAQADVFEQYVIDRMEYEGVDGVKADHTSFTPSHKIMASIQNETEFVEWATENDPDLVALPKPRKGDLNSLVKRLTDDDEELPPGIGVFVKRSMSMRASNS